MHDKQLAFLGTPGFVRDPDRFDVETLLRVLGANSGNLLFQHAATKLVSNRMWHIGLSEIPYSDSSGTSDADFLLFPAANHLRLNADWTGLSGFIESAKKPLILLGLGAQSPKIGGERETIEALKADAQVRRLADVISSNAVFVTVRGEYSRVVCEELGIPDVVAMGCPSAMINPDPNIGVAMEAKLKAIRAYGKAPLFGLTAAAPFEIAQDAHKKALEVKLFQWLRHTGGVYYQQSGGPNAVLASGPRWTLVAENVRRSIRNILQPTASDEEFWNFMERKGRFYVSAEDWFADTAKLDVVLGTRLHGNMAAIASGTPGIVIAHDSRTGELIDTMHLPALTFDDVMASANVSELIEKVRFDGAAFDAWRSRTAASMVERLEKLGLNVTPKMKALAAPPSA